MSEHYTRFARRYGPYDRSLRAADSDRESVAEILREQHAAGRLDTDELQERVERCYAAKTYAELDSVVADLPQEPDRAPAGRFGWHLPRVALLALLIAFVLAASHGHAFWIAIPLLFVFVFRPLLWRAGGGRYGRGPFGCGARHTDYV
jgi:hypothetical protein